MLRFLPLFSLHGLQRKLASQFHSHSQEFCEISLTRNDGKERNKDPNVTGGRAGTFCSSLEYVGGNLILSLSPRSR